MSETPKFESGPEQEGTIEERISRVFKNWTQNSVEFGKEGLEHAIKEEFPEARVELVFRPTSASEMYFLNDRRGSSLLALRIEIGGRSFLLPKPYANDKFETMAYASDNNWELNNIQPIPLKLNGQRWEADIPGERETVVVGQRSEITSGVRDEGLESKLESNENSESKLQRVFSSWLEQKGENLSIDSFRIFLQREIPNATVSFIYRNAGSWEGEVYFTEESEGNPQKYWKVEIEGSVFLLPRTIEGHKDSFGDKGKSIEIGLIGEDGRFIKPLILKMGYGRWELDTPKSQKSEKVGAGGAIDFGKKAEPSQGSGIETSDSEIEDKKREAYGLYIEFTTLLAELNKMSGDLEIAIDQKSLDDGFVDEMQGLMDSDLDGYISDLKQRIAGIKTQIESNQRNSVDERKRKKVGVGGGDDVTVKDADKRGDKNREEAEKREIFPEALDIRDITSDLPPQGPGEGALPLGVEGEKAQKTEKSAEFKRNDERERFGLKLRFESEDLDLQDGEVDYYKLNDTTEKYFIALRDCIKNYFITPSVRGVGKSVILSNALTNLVFLHNGVVVRNSFSDDFERLEDFPQFRKTNLDSIKIGDKTFKDFAIEKNDLEEIFKNARELLGRKIVLARRLRKINDEVVEETEVEGTGAAPVEDKGGVIDLGEFEEGPLVRGEVETEGEGGPETVVLGREGVLHNWKKKTLQVLTLGGLFFGLNSWLTKKEDSGDKDIKLDRGSATNRIEHIEKEKTPLQKLEGSLTNFVSPRYLEKIKALDKVEAVSGKPLMTGFEKIKPGLEKDLEFIWNDQNGFYPRGWISGKFSTINFSDGTYGDVETPDTVKEPGNKKNIGTYDGNTRSINFYVNGTNQLSTLVTNRESMYKFVNGLDKTFAHEIGHANDWTGNWAYPRIKDEGEMTDSDKESAKNPDYKYQKRLTLLGSVLSRLESANRLHFKAVEDIPESQKELKAGEYWASICDTYFEFPEKMEKEHKEDFDLVNEVVQDMDPGFNSKVAKSARYEVISNLGKEDVTLLVGGKTKIEDFRKKVVEGLKGIGGKPRYFNAYTQTEK